MHTGWTRRCRETSEAATTVTTVTATASSTSPSIGQRPEAFPSSQVERPNQPCEMCGGRVTRIERTADGLTTNRPCGCVL